MSMKVTDDPALKGRWASKRWSATTMHLHPSVLRTEKVHPHIAACGQFSYGSLTDKLRLITCRRCLKLMKGEHYALASRLERDLLRKRAAQVPKHEQAKVPPPDGGVPTCPDGGGEDDA